MRTLYTSGVVGAPAFLTGVLMKMGPGYQYLTLDQLSLNGEREYFSNMPRDMLHIIDLRNVEYELEDLKSNRLFASCHFKELHAVFDAFCRRIPNSANVAFLAHEHGLGFVPMQEQHRELIRRETEITALVTPFVHQYNIVLAGNTLLTVFNRPVF